MRIGVDFDGVVTDVAALMVTYAAERLGAVLRPEQIVPPAGPAAIGAELYQRLIDETHATPVSLLVEPLPTAMETLLRLRVEHDLVVVTARYGDAMGFAERWLEGRLAAELQEGPACAVLVGVERPELAGALPPELVAGTVARLRARYERVVVDLGSPPDPGALRATDHTLLVTAADLVSLWNARLALRSLGEDEGGRWSVIVNRREGREHYAGEEIERALGVPVLGVIREDRRAARRAIERQAALSEVGGKAAADLEAIAAALEGVFTP